LKLSSIVLALFFCVYLQGQETIELNGKILNDTIAKTSVTIINLSLQKGAITNTSGEFTISARKQDTIYISAVQYEPRQFVVSEKVYKEQKVSFYLVPKVTELDEVLLNNKLLSGSLDQDATHKLIQNDLESIKKADKAGLIKDLPKTSAEERRLYTATSGTGAIDINFVTLTKIPLQGLINRISGKRKKLKKHLEVANQDREVQRIKAMFSYDFYRNTLGLQEAFIDDFMIYLINYHDMLAIDFEDKLVLLEFMQARAPGFVELLSPQEEIKND